MTIFLKLVSLLIMLLALGCGDGDTGSKTNDDDSDNTNNTDSATDETDSGFTDTDTEDDTADSDSATDSDTEAEIPNPRFLKDILTDRNKGSDPREFVRLGDQILYRGWDFEHGAELWKTDGTEAGTGLLKDIAAGSLGSKPGNMVAIGDVVYFGATDANHGRELWKTDGTVDGTVMVKNIAADSPASAVIVSSNPTLFTQMGDYIYFSATDGSGQLWRTDGTEDGTTKVSDIRIVTRTGMVVVNDRLVFQVNDSVVGQELGVSDGTTEGTEVMDIRHGTSDFIPSFFTVLDNAVYFSAKSDNGFRLYKYDGVSAAPERVTPLDNDVASIEPLELTRVGDQIYFVGNQYQSTLWKTDGTALGTVQVQRFGNNPLKDLVAVGDKIVFCAGTAPSTTLYASDGTVDGAVELDSGWLNGTRNEFFNMHQNELYYIQQIDRDIQLNKTDGTVAGTEVVTTLEKTAYYDFHWPVSGGDYMVLAYDDGIIGDELWQLDSTADIGISPVSDALTTTEGANIFGLTALDDYVVFWADSASHDTNSELWVSDGTTEGTKQLLLITGETNRSPLTLLDNVVYFRGKTPDGDNGLWKTDGTIAGTQLVTEIDTASRTGIRKMVAGNGVLFFSVASYNGDQGTELWRSDGTADGTYIVKDINPNGDSTPIYPTMVGDTLYFVADDGVNGQELWKSDGTDEGTTRVSTITEDATNPQISNLTAVGGRLFFTTVDNRYELWVSDGTDAGTAQVVFSNFIITDLTAVGETLYFVADLDANRHELWKSDGTFTGTELVADINPDGNSGPKSLLPMGNNTLIFLATVDNEKHSVYLADDTTIGVTLLKAGDFFYGQTPYDPWPTVAAGKAYIKGYTVEDGWRTWAFDGTADGVERMPVTFYNYQLVATANQLFFVGNDSLHGEELWVYDLN